MPGKATLKTHADLVDRMAGALGVDLEQSMMEGRLNMDQLGDAVLACTGCSSPAACQEWLRANGGQAMPEAPEYCRNRDTLQRLSDGKRA